MKEILAVDDDREILKLVKVCLEREGVAVRCVETGEEALDELREKTFHLMIVDLDLPGQNGFAVSSEARTIAPDLPIIIMTGDMSPDVQRLAKEAGIIMVLLKPVNPPDLTMIVNGLIS